MANVIIDLFHVAYLRLLQRPQSIVRKKLFTMGSDPIVFSGVRNCREGIFTMLTP